MSCLHYDTRFRGQISVASFVDITCGSLECASVSPTKLLQQIADIDWLRLHQCRTNEHTPSHELTRSLVPKHAQDFVVSGEEH
ncbi:hypothetical protein CSC66_09360 [Pseudoxanthomonas kaohsiungensis]|nr:hypothetical protein CSC66_09360 [Pseudoxanthomonas kaohsiungensis]